MDTLLEIIPSVQKWVRSDGVLILAYPINVILTSSHAKELSVLVKNLHEDFQTFTGMEISIQVGDEPKAGDILLTLDPHLNDVGDQGYELELQEFVHLNARTGTGIFYGIQTLLQMFIFDGQTIKLLRGAVKDEPNFRQRGVMLDLGRKYWDLEYLYKLIRQMSHLKLNTLHLHLSDWNGFRLKSDIYPEINASRVYSRHELVALEAYAKERFITIIPEIDFPAHATVFTRHNPSLAFDCDMLSKPRWPGGEYGGFTLDFTNPKVQQWIRNLLSEFIPWFDSPYFHIGGDEVAIPEDLTHCPSLFRYIKARGYPHLADGFVEWINEMNAFVKSYGKQMQIWNWWERFPHSINPDPDIIINDWLGPIDSHDLLNKGYSVINSPEEYLYVTPGIDLLPKADYLYHQWSLNPHPKMLGYKICVWADQRENASDAYFDSYLQQPMAILAQRTWNHNLPPLTLDDFVILSRNIAEKIAK